MGLVLWVGGHKVLAGEITVGTLAAVPHLHDHPADAGAPARADGQLLRPRLDLSGTRLFEVLDREPDIADRPGARDLVVTDGVLRFENVAFAYPGEGRELPTLHDISFEVRAGRDARHRRPAGQRQVDHRASDPALLRRQRRARSPSTARTSATSRCNRCARRSAWCSRTRSCSPPRSRTTSPTAIPGPTRERIDAAERVRAAARLHRRACRRATTTLVGERGVSLSGGQRQRLSIARSLMLQPPVLVFDDSTAAIDAGTEQRIRAALRTLRQRPRDDHHLAPAELADACRPDPVPRGRHASSSAARTPSCWRWAAATQPLRPAELRRRAAGRRRRRPGAGAMSSTRADDPIAGRRGRPRGRRAPSSARSRHRRGDLRQGLRRPDRAGASGASCSPIGAGWSLAVARGPGVHR